MAARNLSVDPHGTAPSTITRRVLTVLSGFVPAAYSASRIGHRSDHP